MASLAIELPRKAQELFKPSRYKIIHGGRGSGKSWSVARVLILIARERKCTILCVREIQGSIKESVYQLLSDQIKAFGMENEFTLLSDRIVCRLTGSLFWFEGLYRNDNGIRSKEGVDICWIEEGDSISKESWGFLVPTIRKPKSEIWVTFNPQEATDLIYAEFVLNTHPNAHVNKWNFDDNPWFKDSPLLDEMIHMRKVDPKNARHVWDGFPRDRSVAAVFPDRWRVEAFEPNYTAGPYQGADWGFSVDPTVILQCGIARNKLYVRYESYATGCPIEQLDVLFGTIPDARRYHISADNARPELIRHLADKRWNIGACLKGPGSVEDGLDFLRSFDEIIIHPDCKHTIDEFNLYRYKVDKRSGLTMPELVDRDNHCIDALRYAVERLMRDSKAKPRVRSL